MSYEAVKAYLRSRYPEPYEQLRFLRHLPGRLWTQLLKSNYWLYAWTCWWSNYERERKRTKKMLGYEPNLRVPETINEKIIWKKLHNRDPLLTRTTDKLAVRDYVQDRLGEEADDLLVPLLQTSERPGELSLSTLTPPYVIKANHGSGFNLFVHEQCSEDSFIVSTEDTTPARWSRTAILQRCHDWLDTAYGFREHEWAYRHIDRKLLVEPFIEDAFGSRLTDIKFDCFSGQSKYVLIKINRSDRSLYSVLDADGNRIPAEYGENRPEVPARIVRRLTPLIRQLRTYASRLSEPFDFCRVDFYAASEDPYFGEITHYPSSGRRRLLSKRLDRKFGREWTIDSSSNPVSALWTALTGPGTL